MKEHNIGCITVKLTDIGGITVSLRPVCAVDLGPVVPLNALRTVDGIPLITSDGYYLIVENS